MKKVAELRQELAQLIAQQRQIVDPADAEKRELTPEERTKFDEKQNEIKAKKEELQRAIDLEENLRHVADNPQPGQARSFMPPVHMGGDGGEARELAKIYGEFRMGMAVASLRSGKGIDGVVKEVNDIAVSELRNLGLAVINEGFNIPASMMRASAQTVTEDGGAYGGKLVKEAAGELLTPFVPRLTVEELGVKVLMGLTGDYPLISSEEFEFQNLAETAAATVQKVEYDKRILKPKRSACVAAISNQLLIQSSIDVENDIRANIGRALNRRVFMDLINGSGTGANPLGLLQDDILESATAQGIIARAKANELRGLVMSENATKEKLAFLMHTLLYNNAANVKIDEGSGLFLVDAQGNFNNTKTFETSMVPILDGEDPGDKCYPLIYGDWDAARVGFWGGMNIQADPYTGMAANTTKLVINVHKDSMASNPKAFAVNRTITLA